MSKFVHKYFSKMFRETQSNFFSREWSIMKRLYQIKNWTLLGYRLRRITRNGLSGDEQALLEFYAECLIHVQEYLDPYVLIGIVEVIVRAMHIEEKPLAFLYSLHDTVKHSTEALQYIRILQGHILLHKYGSLSAVKNIVEELRVELEAELEPEPMQQRNYEKFHTLAAAYYFQIGQWDESFSSRMKYLGQDLKYYQSNLWAEQAFLLAVNAMLVEDKYEFGDVQHHRIMDGLHNDSREWMLDVLNVFRTGNVDRFKELRSSWIKVPELCKNEEMLMQRLYVINFLSVVSQRSNMPCFIHFVEVAMELRGAVADVVGVVRRAINTGLIDAVINLTTEVIEVYSIKPMYFEPLVDFDLIQDDVTDFEVLWNSTD